MFKNNDNKVFKKLQKKLKNVSSDFKVLPIKYKGKNVLQVTVTDDRYKSKGYSRAKIQKIGNEISQTLDDNNVHGLIWSCLKFDQYYRTAQASSIGNEVNLYDIDEYNNEDDARLEEEFKLGQQSYFKKAIFYIGETPNNPAGGEDNKYNDCLFMCLHYALLNENPFKRAKQLKDFLGLKRADFVHIDDIHKIETALKKVKINVTGDYIYSSTLQKERTINLKLINNHYTIDHSVNNKNSGFSYTEKKPIIHDNVNKIMYDGVSLFQSTIEFIQECNHFRTDYIIIPYVNKKITIQQEYDNFIKTANRLKEISKGVINLYKTGTIKNTALYLFDKFTKTICIPEEIGQDEAIYLSESTLAAIINFTEYEGEAWKYDVKSMYPSIQASTRLVVPVKRGDFKILTEEEFNQLEYLAYGIYRCKIYESIDPNVNKLFRFNYYNKYNHIDLNTAKKIGLKIELIQDKKPNVLLYPRNKCLTCHELFNKFTQFLFPLKEIYGKEEPIIKQILNILWGALSQTNEIRTITYDKEINIEDDKSINNIKPTRDERGTIIDVVENNYYFKSNFARLKPFLLSKGRSIIASIMFPYKDHVVRCHTDGFVVKNACDIKTGDKLGDLVYEGYSKHVVIKNNAKPKGNFVKESP